MILLAILGIIAAAGSLSILGNLLELISKNMYPKDSATVEGKIYDETLELTDEGDTSCTE